MRVLVISEFFPFDPHRDVFGAFQRLRMFVDALGSLGDLHAVFYVPAEVDASPRATARREAALTAHWGIPLSISLAPRFEKLRRQPPGIAAAVVARSLWNGAFSFFTQRVSVQTSGPQALGVVESVLRERRPDLVFAHRLGATAPLLLTRLPLPPVFVDMDDVEHVKLARQAGGPGRRSSRLRRRLPMLALRRAEARAVRLARRVFVCSEDDRLALAGERGDRGIVTVPNASALPRVEPPAIEPTLLFLGTYAYPPNVDAAEFLLREIWPRIRRAEPGARLCIAGPFPESIPSRRDAAPGVSFPGFVEDLDDLYRGTRVVCCPVRSGSGTRVKIIEAAAHGRPVVATPVGAEGLGMTDGREILLRDDAESFAGACIDLLRDPNRCRHLGAAARRHAESHHDRRRVVATIRNRIREALSESRPGPPAAGHSGVR